MNLESLKISIIALQAWQLFEPGPEISYGGSEVQCKLLAEHWQRWFGCRARIFTLAATAAVRRFDGVEVETISRRHSPFGKMKRIQRALAAFNADVVIQRAWGFETWLAADYAKKNRKKFVYMLAHLEDLDPFRPRELLAPRRMFFHLGFPRADKLVVQTRDQFERLRPAQQRKAVLIRSIQPPPDTTAAGEREGVLWVGRAIPFKRPEALLELAERLPAIPFTMILNRTHHARYCDELYARACRLANLRLIEKVPYDQIMEHFRRARIFINTSNREGFPNTILQACRACTAIFTLDYDPDGVVAAHQLGLAGGEDLPRFAAALAEHYAQPERLAQAGRRAGEYLRREHGGEKLREQWRALFTELLG